MDLSQLVQTIDLQAQNTLSGYKKTLESLFPHYQRVTTEI